MMRQDQDMMRSRRRERLRQHQGDVTQRYEGGGDHSVVNALFERGISFSQGRWGIAATTSSGLSERLPTGRSGPVRLLHFSGESSSHPAVELADRRVSIRSGAATLNEQVFQHLQRRGRSGARTGCAKKKEHRLSSLV